VEWAGLVVVRIARMRGFMIIKGRESYTEGTERGAQRAQRKT
jgi:hypothetical protein